MKKLWISVEMCRPAGIDLWTWWKTARRWDWEKNGCWLLYSFMRNLCAARTAVFSVTAHICWVSGSGQQMPGGARYYAIISQHVDAAELVVNQVRTSCANVTWFRWGMLQGGCEAHLPVASLVGQHSLLNAAVRAEGVLTRGFSRQQRW